MENLSKQQFSSFVNVYQNGYYVDYDILLDCRGYKNLFVTSTGNYYYVYPYDYNTGKDTENPLGARNQQNIDVTDYDFVVFYITCSGGNNNGHCNNNYILS